MLKTLRTSLIALVLLPLSAQTPGFSVGGGPIFGLDSLRKATHNALGFTLGGDYDSHILENRISSRVGLALALMPGSENHGLKTSLTLFQAHGDLMIPTGSEAWHGVAGLSLNSYSMSRSGTESQDPLDVDHHFPVRDAKGLKLGLRVGVNVTFSKSMSSELLFQQTELAGKDLQDPLIRQGGINPAWLELDFRFHF
jgi:hypothetical protein